MSQWYCWPQYKLHLSCIFLIALRIKMSACRMVGWSLRCFNIELFQKLFNQGTDILHQAAGFLWNHVHKQLNLPSLKAIHCVQVTDPSDHLSADCRQVSGVTRVNTEHYQAKNGVFESRSSNHGYIWIYIYIASSVVNQNEKRFFPLKTGAD